MKRLETMTEVWIISDIKCHVCEGDKGWGAQARARLLTHNGAAPHTNPDGAISPGSTVLPRPDLPVTVSLNATTSLCQYVQTHTAVTPKHVKNLLALPNMLTKTQARLKCPDMGKLGSAWFVSAGAHGRPDKEQWAHPPQVSVQSWHDLFQASCCDAAWCCVSICHLCPLLMQRQVTLQLYAASTISFCFFS